MPAALISIFLLLVMPATSMVVAVRATQEQLESTNSQEAAQLAARFTSLLRENEDFTPVFDELFSDTYLDCFLDGQECVAPFSGVYFNNILAFKNKQLVRGYLITALNCQYLSMRCLYGERQRQDGDAGERFHIKDIPGFASLLEHARLLSAIIQYEEGRHGKIKIKTIEELKQLTNELEQAIALMRDYLSNHPIVEIAEIAPHYYFEKANKEICPLLYDKDTVYIKVGAEAFLPPQPIPIDFSYQLICQRINGKLQIICIGYGDFY